MNKFLKKSLSVALAVAMLMTVCAVSFGASAAVGSSVNWDFTDDATNAASLAELKENATFFGSQEGGYPDNYTIATPTDNRLLDPPSVLNIATAGSKNVNGFVLNGAVPTSLHAVVGEKRTQTNAVGWSRSTDGLIFAQDSIGGYFQFMPYIPGTTGAVRVAVRYIKQNENKTYVNTVAQNHLADINTVDITKVVYDNGDEETPESLTTTGLACAVPQDANYRVKYDIKAKFDGKKVTFSVTVINAATNSPSAWRDSFKRNGKTVASYTLADIVLDLENPDEYSNVTASGTTPFTKQYKVNTMTTDYNADNIEFVAGIVIAPQEGSGAGYVYSFAGEFGSSCAHANKYEVIDKVATCLTAGTGHWYCPDCKKDLDSYPIPQLEHGSEGDHCLMLFPSVVITDGVIGVGLKAGMAAIPSQTDTRWQMDMRIDGGEWTRATDNSQKYKPDGTYLGYDEVVDEVKYFTKSYPGKVVDPTTGAETKEDANPNAVHMTDITKFYDQMTQEITVDVRYAPAYVIAENGKSVFDYMVGEGSIPFTEDGSKRDYDAPFADSNALSKTFTFTIADLLKGVYETDGITAEFKDLAVKTANYGAAAQSYFGHTDEYDDTVANYWVGEAEKAPADNAYTTVESVANATKANDDVKLAATVQLKEKLGISVATNAIGAKAVLVDKDGNETPLTPEEAKQNGEVVGTKFNYFGITASQMGDKYTVKITDADGADLGTVEYSVNSYIARQGANENASAALKTLVNAMAEFYNAAMAVVKA